MYDLGECVNKLFKHYTAIAIKLNYFVILNMSIIVQFNEYHNVRIFKSYKENQYYQQLVGCFQ